MAKLFLLFVWLVCLPGRAWATEVTLRLVDQNRTLIAASQFDVVSAGKPSVPQQGTVTLSPGSHSILVRAGISGHITSGILERKETVTISGISQTVELVWKTAPLVVNVNDAQSVRIAGSLIRVGVYRPGVTARTFATIATGQTIPLPVTEDPESPAIQGAVAGGYELTLLPGISGHQGFIERLEPGAELTPAGSTRTFQWKTAPVKVSLVDQNEVPIPGSLIRIGSPARMFATIATGQTIQLPVTEDPETTPITGAAAGGYGFLLHPGISGHQGFMERFEPGAELTSAGITRTFRWKTAPVQVSLVDQNDVPIPGSLIRIGSPARMFATIATGQTIQLPVTEDPETTPITGPAAGGHGFLLHPGINGHQGYLERFESVAELTSAGISRTFQWKTAPVTMDLLDQTGAPIPGSQVGLGLYQSASTSRDFTSLPPRATIRLPVTEDPETSPIAGVAAGGYQVKLLPGINDRFSGGVLDRTEPAEELTIAGRDRTFIWEVAKGTLHVVNAAESEVAGASYLLGSSIPESKTGTVVKLPVNDKLLYPTLAGTFAAGYPFSIRMASGAVMQAPVKFVVQFRRTVQPLFAPIANAQHGLRFELAGMADRDGDGSPGCVDCNDADPKVNPQANELPGDAIDQNCDGELACSSTGTYRNHEAYVSCVTADADALLKAGRITEADKAALVKQAVESDVGK